GADPAADGRPAIPAGSPLSSATSEAPGILRNFFSRRQRGWVAWAMGGLRLEQTIGRHVTKRPAGHATGAATCLPRAELFARFSTSLDRGTFSRNHPVLVALI